MRVERACRVGAGVPVGPEHGTDDGASGPTYGPASRSQPHLRPGGCCGAWFLLGGARVYRSGCHHGGGVSRSGTLDRGPGWPSCLGFVEIDLAGHQVGSPSVSTPRTLTAADIATGQTENRWSRAGNSNDHAHVGPTPGTPTIAPRG